METCYLDECKIKFSEFEKKFMEKVEEQRELICQRIKCKGKKYNVIPYSEERLGNKLNGKEIAEIEMKDGYCVYCFDKEGRIRLVEHAVSSLKKFYYFELYDYEGEKIYAYYCSLISSSYASVNIFEGDKIRESYKIYGDDRWSYNNYIYQGDNLSRINVCIQDIYGERREWQENFFYDKKKKLKIIQQEESGHRRNSFCDRKLNYKKIEVDLGEQIKESCKEIYQSNSDVKVEGIEIAIDSIEEIPGIHIHFIFENKEQQLKTGSYTSEKIILRDFPLDDFEIEKVINSILRVIVKLWGEKILDEDVYVEVAKEGVDILEEKGKLPRWFNKNVNIYFLEGKIRYRHVARGNLATTKSIEEIYMNMKRAVNRGNNLQKHIEVFERMCRITVNNASNGEDLFSMNAETILFNENLMFGFLLIRQIPFGDEFVQIGMKIIYELDDNNKTIAETFWSDEVEEDFFQFVKSTDIYVSLCKRKVYDIDTFMRET